MKNKPPMRPRPLALMLLLALLLGSPVRAETPMTDAEREVFRAEVHDYLLANPEVLMEMLALLDARQKADAEKGDAALVASNAKALFEDGYSYVGGNPQGSVTVVEFIDYQCGFCRKSFPELHDLITADGDIRLIVKDFPILGPGSDLAARATTATMITAGPDAYAKLHAALMAAKGPVTDASLDRALAQAGLDGPAIRAGMDDPEIDRRLAQTHALAQTLAITGTPTFVFGDQMVRGYVALAEMEKLVDELRATN